MISTAVTLASAAAAVLLGASMRVVADQKSTDVPITVRLPKERIEMCQTHECTIVSKDELNALVNAAEALQREKDSRRLDSNGCVKGLS